MVKREQIDKLLQYLRAGMNITDSCDMVDISRDTFYKRQKKDSQFAKAVNKAGLECKLRNIAIIQKAAEVSWQAAGWWLERKYSNEFALKNIQELRGEGGQPIIVKIIGDYASKRGGNVSSSKASPEN